MTTFRKTIPLLRIRAACVLMLCIVGLPVAMAQQHRKRRHGTCGTPHLLIEATSERQRGGRQAELSRCDSSGTRHGVSADTVIGITLWRLRPTRPRILAKGSSTTMAENRLSGFLSGYRPAGDYPKATVFA